MSTVRKAYPGDFEFIVPLLEKFNNPEFTKERWHRLFKKHWESDEEHIGYVMIDNDIPVGFFGTIFNKRYINNNLYKYCGLSSWIVLPEYRNESLYLINEVNCLNEYTITSYTSIPEAILILKKNGFKELDNSLRWVSAKQIKLYIRRKIYYCSDPNMISGYLNNSEKKIFTDHSSFNCFHIVFLKNDITCYLIFKTNNFLLKKLISSKFINYFNSRIIKIFKKQILEKKIFAAKIHYISNLNFFNKHLAEITKIISGNFNVSGILFDNRFFTKKFNLISFKSNPQISLYKSQYLYPCQIDSLYSEIFVLDF